MIRFQIKMQEFNGTTCRTAVLEASEPKARHVDEVRISNKCRTEGSSFMRIPCRNSHIARRPVSALWTLNYTTNSSTEAMTSGNRYYWKVRALDGGGEQ